MVTEKANIQGQIALKRKEFVQKEAHLYFNAYREITDEVKYFCRAARHCPGVELQRRHYPRRQSGRSCPRHQQQGGLLQQEPGYYRDHRAAV